MTRTMNNRSPGFKSLPGLDSSLNGAFEATAFSTKDVIKNAMKQIDTRLATLDDSARILKRQRNAISPIAKLPPEILCSIFQHVREADRKRNPGRIGWVRVSHVCAKWREIAINVSSLWTYIEYHYGQEWVQEMLIRSKPAPLHISADFSAEFSVNTERFISTISPHFHHIKELSIRTSGGPKKNLIQQLFELPTATAPLLEKLYLGITSDGQSRVLPMDLFPGGTPLLRHLELENCPIDWDSPIIRNPLTTLKLAFHREFRASVNPSVEDVISILQCMPSLEVLELRNILRPIHTPARAAYERNVNLTHLKSLSIDADLYEINHLLNHLILSPTTSIALESSARCATSIQDFPLSIPSITHCGNFPRRGATCLSKLGCTYNGYSDIVFELWTSSWDVSTPQLSLRLTYVDDRELYTIVDMFLVANPLDNLKTLRVDGFPEGFPSKWLPSFGRLDTLETICINGTEAGVARALSSSIHTNLHATTEGEKNKPALAFPALSKLEITACNFRDMLPEFRESNRYSGFDRLHRALTMRKRCRQGIDTLVLNSCRFLSEDQVEQLELHVKEVIWDGESFMDAEDEESSTENDSDGNSIRDPDYY